ncbi:uncharacterized protein LOC115879024 [Sitophilus oryzae]|uniref:Uncharacterized protein LOC115879024 n=1 Tax=Sitophilus oryzae TaxID=7048 RepID=A0A6J2XJP0_SITOR|nr:uncharacterized protein LOC115879024 [Sitophilus oryzae]
MSFVVDLIKHIAALLGIFREKGNDELLREGLHECTKATRHINYALKNASSVAEKQQLQAALINVKTLRQQFKLKQKKGAGLNKKKATACSRVKWEDLHSAFDSRVRTGVIINLHHTDPKLFLNDCKALFKRRIQNMLKKVDALKVNGVFSGEFTINKADQVKTELKYLNTKNGIIYKDYNLDNWFVNHIQNSLLVELEEFQEKDSGWALSEIKNLTVNINKYNPLRAGTFIDLPTQIKRKEACVNVQNSDDMCFAWAVLSYLYPVSSEVAKRTSSYPDPQKVLNLKGIQFPMTLKQIPRFEKQNNLSINVYRLEQLNKSFNVIPTHLTKNKLERHINLLMIQDNYFSSDNEEQIFTPVKFHYVWIKNLSRLVSSQINKKHGKKIICDRCLHYFYDEDKLNLHLKDYFSFKTKVPFTIYADSECLLIPTEDNKTKNTQKYQSHIPFSVGYYVKCDYDDSLSFYKSYTGPDCIEWFVKELFDFAENVETVFLCDLPMDMLTPEQTRAFLNSKLCHICESPFNTDDKKVRDHCHLTGRYRGAAHEKCNLNFQDKHIVPVLFHNFSSYDGHLLIKALAEVEGSIDVLPVNKEKYISVTKHVPGNFVQFRFLDSFRFMASSLDTLASNLSEYPILKSEFPHLNEEHFNLLTRKGIFPYDFMDDWNKLNETQLPPKPAFYNKLNDSYINDKDYAHAKTVWNIFNCQNMRDYSELYMKVDILLLADIFEQFRTTSHKTYCLDPAHTYTLPGYAWQCMLFQMRKSDIKKLELLTDLDMVLFIEKGIRGGLSQCSKRYAEANNKYIPSYDSSKDETYLMYFDINNQYGWAMSQYLPYGGFKWLNENEISNLNIQNISNESNKGYILEVDLYIPSEVHDFFSDLPPCPEHDIPKGSKNSKLLATLYDKKEYVVHYKNLQQALALGVRVRKIHRVLEFNQSPWLKSYIDLNTRLRQASKNDFEKNLFKLMNNAVFGKTMENIRKHSSVKLITMWEGRYGAESLISRPEFKSSTIINENLIIIELSKSEIYFNKPIYVGMCILDLAKTTIYDFHYNYMKKTFSDCTVLYTDTDSLIYEIKNQDVYDVIKRDCSLYFDTSDYSPDNIYSIPLVNKKILGMMKDENSGRTYRAPPPPLQPPYPPPPKQS